MTPKATLPKLRLLGAIEIAGCMPVPAREIATEPCLLESERLPCTEPGAEGRKDTLKLADCAGCKSKGNKGPLKLKPPPVTVAPEMVVIDAPMFVTVRDWALLLPTVMFPKSTLLGAASCRCFRAANEEAQAETQTSNTTTSATVIPFEVAESRPRRGTSALPDKPPGGRTMRFAFVSDRRTGRA